MKKSYFLVVFGVFLGLAFFLSETNAFCCRKKQPTHDDEEIEAVRASAKSAFVELNKEVSEMKLERARSRRNMLSNSSCGERPTQRDDTQDQEETYLSLVMERYRTLVDAYNVHNIREKADFSFQEMELISEMEDELYGLFLLRRYTEMKTVLREWIELQILILRKEGIMLRGDGEIGRYQIGRWNIRFFGKRRVLYAKLLIVGTREDFRKEVEGMTFPFTR